MNVTVRVVVPRAWKSNLVHEDLCTRIKATFIGAEAPIDPSTTVLVTNALKPEEVELLMQLSAVICPTSGTESLPIDKLRERGIRIYSNKEVIAECVAEFVEDHLSVLLSENRLQEMRELSILLLGYGAIGSRVYERLSRRGGHYTIVRRASGQYPSTTLCRYVSLHDVVTAAQEADLVINTLPASYETRGLLRTQEDYAYGASVLSIGRAGVIDEKVVVEGVLSGKLYAAVLDVYPWELHRYRGIHPRLHLTGHIAGIWNRGTTPLCNFILSALKEESQKNRR